MTRKRSANKAREALGNAPLFQMAALGASALILGAVTISKTATPERRRKLAEKLADRQRKQDALREQSDLKLRRSMARKSYFASGPGHRLYHERAYKIVESEDAHSDAYYEQLPSKSRSIRFQISSKSNGLCLSAAYSAESLFGSIELSRESEVIWETTANFYETTIFPTEVRDRDWTNEATLAARLLAVPQSQFRSITLLRPNAKDVEAPIWTEYMRTNPDLARDLGWDPGDPMA